jgi:hypothetical protein
VVGAVVGFSSVGNSDSHPVITEAKTSAWVTFTETRQSLHAGPCATAVGQKQASFRHAVAAESIALHWPGQFSCRRCNCSWRPAIVFANVDPARR